ncbi:50S ribosomal protein L11 methyltransferase [bacterium]|nr:50S ribosomal protein L11 methyltransferase [bacterium]
MKQWIQLTVPTDFSIEQFEIIEGYRGCFEQNDALIAYFDNDELTLDTLRSFGPKLIDESAWEERWKEFFSPVAIGGFVVVPPWRKDEGSFVINPARGFGTGHHETTQLAAEQVIRLIDETTPLSLLDVGTGSGILAIMAKKHNKNITVVGVDNDPDAIENAIENAGLNSVADVDLKVADIAKMDGTYDVVIANIISSILLSLRDDLIRLTKKHLILSGILEGEKQRIIDAFQTDSLRFTGVMTQKGEWISLVFEVA